jgi:hypothetical protein
VSLDVSLLLVQVPYLPPDDQQTLPTTLRELRLVDGAFGNAVPLKLSHLTAVSRLVFVGNSSMPGKVFGSIGGPGAYCLVRGSALPPAVQQLEVQAVASMEPILKLQHLQVRPCRESQPVQCYLPTLFILLNMPPLKPPVGWLANAEPRTLSAVTCIVPVPYFAVCPKGVLYCTLHVLFSVSVA